MAPRMSPRPRPGEVREQTFVRGLDATLYRRVRVAAVADGIRMAEAINAAMAMWLRARDAEAGVASQGD